MSSWLITGGQGQLGRDLQHVLQSAGENYTAVDLPDVDITDAAAVAELVGDLQPDWIVNAAAYTAVDAAEADEDTAFRVNALGARNLALAAGPVPASRLIQISTDYVFDGQAKIPYREDTPVRPASAYGRTKAAGEEEVLSLLADRSYIVRTAWLYGRYGNNFVYTMLKLADQHPTLTVVNDQVGQPTWSYDLARQLLVLAEVDAPPGIYHGTASGSTTWFGFTRAIFALAGLDPERVQPTTTEAFPRPAPRPAYSVLGHDRWEDIEIEPLRHWEEALTDALPLLMEELHTPTDRK